MGFLKPIVIGATTTKTGKPAKALVWFENEKIKIGYVGKHRTGETVVRQKTIRDRDVTWDQPLEFVLGTGNDAALSRLESLVRYYFLAKVLVDSPYMNDALREFTTHFIDTYQAVASEYKARAEEFPNSGEIET